MSSMERETTHIYILLTNTGTFFSRAIGVYTRAPYNHVSIGFNRNLRQLYSFGRKKPRNPFFGGFVTEHIKKGVYACFVDTTCCLYSLTVTKQELRELRKVVKSFKREEERYGYNLIGLLGFVVNKPIPRKNAYFCSQFVATVLERGGIGLFDKPPELTRPHDFQCLHQLQLLYEGKLSEYRPSLCYDSSNGYYQASYGF